jgi:phenylalanyl-tRNA synthetase alpha subunit
VGIRDFIEYLNEHQDRLKRSPELSDAEREETLKEAETMVGMADAAIREIESVLKNRRVNLPEEHALRFAQDVFVYLREEEEKVKEALREPASRDAAGH